MKTWSSVVCVMVLGLMVACEHGHDHDHAHGHGHEHKAPHGGSLVSLGDHVGMLEFVLDDKSGKLDAYVLDGEAEKAIIPGQSSLVLKVTLGKDTLDLTLTGVGSALTGETKEKTSHFSGQSDKLKGVKSFKAELTSLKYKGKDFKKVSFPFPEGADEKDDHKDHKH